MSDEEWFFVIHNSEGDTTVTMHSREVLLSKLDEGYWGSDGIMDRVAYQGARSDTNYWGGRLLIIKGTVATVIPPGDWRIE